MKLLQITIFLFLAYFQQLKAQQFPIFNPDRPEIITVWHRVADHAPVLRSVESARLSPDGRLAVSASKFGYNLMVWRVDDGFLLWKKKITAEIESVVFSPNGEKFATGDENFFVTIWDSKSGNILKELEHNSSLDGITWSHDGKIIAAGSENGDVWLWDAITYKLSGKVNVGSTVNSLDFGKDDRILVVGGNIQTPDPITNTTHYGGFVKLIDVSSEKVVRNYEGTRGSVKSVRFSYDGKFIASGGFDSTARVFETATGALIKALNEPLRIEAIIFTPDGQYLVTGGHQRKISFYRLKDFELAYELPCPRTEYIDFSKDGRLMLTAHEDSGLLSLYLLLSNTQHKPGLYHEIENQLLDNRDLK